ncbi:hypothetical protein UFOVP707_12 [uncultured Caudovirales phage]|uniref:Uncharacterized protein n=1 Tax=uncultured Caudovirales phage TaxID=2100421 RepID=A0A6J5NN28_9CAUD|nr:hypothetical protein UFOVP707_12 [uncultured Caudovirales phage]
MPDANKIPSPGDIRAMKSAGDSNWEILSAVVSAGVEFPDAVWKVSSALRLPPEEVDQMKLDYDEIA